MISGESQCQRPSGPPPRPPPAPPRPPCAPRPPRPPPRRRRRPAPAGAGDAVRGRPCSAASAGSTRAAGPADRAGRARLPATASRRCRILRIDARLEAVAAADVVPVAGADAGAVERARRAADRPVVLRAAADVVERPRVVGRHAVELRQRQVGEVPPRLHAVVGLVEAAVVADDDVVGVDRVEHDLVVIDVHAGHRHDAPRSCRRPCCGRSWSAATRSFPGSWPSTKISL